MRRIDSLTHSVFALAWAPDGHLYTGGASCSVMRWDSTTWKPTTESARLPHAIVVLKVSGDGRTIGAGGLNTASFQYPADVWLLDGATLQERRRIHAHSGVVVGLGFSPDGRYVATASNVEGGIKLWNLPAP